MTSRNDQHIISIDPEILYVCVYIYVCKYVYVCIYASPRDAVEELGMLPGVLQVGNKVRPHTCLT